MATIPAKSRAEGTVDRVGKERSWCSSSTNAPHQFALLVKTLVSAAQTPSGVLQAEQLAESFYLALKSETAQQKVHFNDLAESLSAGFSPVEVKQCKKEASKRLEDENYDELGLVKAILGGNVDAVEKCIDSGSYELDTTYSPLHLAAICGLSKMVDALIAAGADINQEGSDGQTVLHYVLKSEIDDLASLVKELIAMDADVNAIDLDRMTPLHVAALYGHSDIVEILILADANLNSRNNDGDTPMHFASECGHTEVVAALIESGARINITNDEGSTPLSLAKEMECTEIAELLVNAGAREFTGSKKDFR